MARPRDQRGDAEAGREDTREAILDVADPGRYEATVDQLRRLLLSPVESRNDA